MKSQSLSSSLKQTSLKSSKYICYSSQLQLGLKTRVLLPHFLHVSVPIALSPTSVVNSCKLILLWVVPSFLWSLALVLVKPVEGQNWKADVQMSQPNDAFTIESLLKEDSARDRQGWTGFLHDFMFQNRFPCQWFVLSSPLFKRTCVTIHI